MALILPLCVAFLIRLQQVDGHSTKEGESGPAGQMNCIYYNKEYVNCTWKRNEEAVHGVNDTFYYWFSPTRLHMKLCSLNEENQTCGLRNKRKANKWLWLYIKTLNHFTLLTPSCFQLQENGTHRLISQKTDTSDLDCTYYDDQYVNCTWKRSKDAMHNMGYEIYYRFSKTVLHLKECNRYLQNQSHNLGCLLREDENVFETNWFYAYVIDSNHFTVVTPEPFLLLELVKVNPPEKLSATLSGKEEVSLTWDVPKNLKPDWLQYEMEYKSNMDSDWQMEEIEGQSFTLPNIDPAKCYYFHLRSRINNRHAKTSYWSEWGPMLIWKKNAVGPYSSHGINAHFLLLPLVAVPAFAVLMCVLYKVKRVKTRLFPGVPDPKHLFVDLFEEHNGNFQEWIGVSKDLNMDLQLNCIQLECQIEDEPMILKIEHEDPQKPPSDKTESTDSVLENINEENEKFAEDVPNSQFPVHKTATFDMSRVTMNENMYIRL
ncbi:cytokine receptor-like factor 2 [Heterodontus francisci]|uniref:cytokine receptor-like factor 2 n=1 Tax=Heterodontus francisci TaxID=7792 RepID=UPI00355C81DD